MPHDQWRLIYVSDPSGNANYDFDPGMARPLITSHPAKPEELQRIIDNVAANRPDTFIQEVYNAGWTLYFRSPRFEYDARPQHRRFIPMMDDGIMPLQVMLDQARKHGTEFSRWFSHERQSRRTRPRGDVSPQEPTVENCGDATGRGLRSRQQDGFHLCRGARLPLSQ